MKTEMCQEATVPPFEGDLRDPEFFRLGIVARVVCDYGRTVRIMREGRAELRQQDSDTVLVDAEDFRNAFPSGEIPREDDGWDTVHIGWFALYTECGRPITVRPIVPPGPGDITTCHDLPEAIELAQTWLVDTGTLLLATAVHAAA